MSVLINKNAASVSFLLHLCTVFQEPFLSLSENWSVCALLDCNQYCQDFLKLPSGSVYVL